MNADEKRALNDARMLADVHDWQACLAACDALTVSDDLILATVARLNVMICHYQQGLYAQVLSADLVHLLDHLPSTARPSCLCVAILAAHQLSEFKMSKVFMLILARWEMEPLDLPGTPRFVMLNGETQSCPRTKPSCQSSSAAQGTPGPTTLSFSHAMIRHCRGAS